MELNKLTGVIVNVACSSFLEPIEGGHGRVKARLKRPGDRSVANSRRFCRLATK